MAVNCSDIPYLDESSLPDPSQPQADFLDTSFFRSASGETRELPSPDSILERDARGWDRGTVAIAELNLLVKFDQAVYLKFDEAVTMRAMRQLFRHDELPVPEIFGWRTHGTKRFIYMSLIHGKTLREAWPSLTEADKASICKQLSNVVSTLRSIKRVPEKTWTGSITGGPVTDRFFQGDYEGGPFETVPVFHEWVFACATRQKPGPAMVIPDVYQEYLDMLPNDSNVYFTHGDLTLSNLLLAGTSGSWKIAGIIDWEQAGWYPEYWEYCKLFNGMEADHGWEGWLNKVTRPFEDAFFALSVFMSWRMK